ncbi:MAG: hypothetical protein ACAH83_13605 [Alphaproteobacteria bacterium]
MIQDSNKTARTEKDIALDDPKLPPILRHLAERVIPEKREAELRALIQEGALDPLMDCEAQPLLSPVSQVMNMAKEDTGPWLKILFSGAPEKIAQAKCPCRSFRNGGFSTDLNYRDYYNTGIETPKLLSVLLTRTETPVVELTSLAPWSLTEKIPDRYGNNGDEPLLHSVLQTREFSVATFDKLEKLTGGVDFLGIKNSRGETLFHRIVSNCGWCEDITRLDVASWMLQRRPELVNEPDRFGWTPLDRMLSLSQGKLDTSMGRLMIVSGARLEKQMATQFNLAAALEERSGSRLDKPAPRKPGGISKNL